MAKKRTKPRMKKKHRNLSFSTASSGNSGNKAAATNNSILKDLKKMGREACELFKKLKSGEEVKNKAVDLIGQVLETLNMPDLKLGEVTMEKVSTYIEKAAQELDKMRNFQNKLLCIMELGFTLSIPKQKLDEKLEQLSARHNKQRVAHINRRRWKCGLSSITAAESESIASGMIVSQVEQEQARLDTEKADKHARELVELVKNEKNRVSRLEGLKKVALHPIFGKSGKEDTSVTLEVPFQKVVKNNTFDTSVGVCFQDRPNKMKLMIDGWIRWPKNKVKYAFDRYGNPCSVDRHGYSRCRKHGLELDRPEHRYKLLVERVDYNKLMENYSILCRSRQSRSKHMMNAQPKCSLDELTHADDAADSEVNAQPKRSLDELTHADDAADSEANAQPKRLLDELTHADDAADFEVEHGGEESESDKSQSSYYSHQELPGVCMYMDLESESSGSVKVGESDSDMSPDYSDYSDIETERKTVDEMEEVESEGSTELDPEENAERVFEEALQEIKYSLGAHRLNLFQRQLFDVKDHQGQKTYNANRALWESNSPSRQAEISRKLKVELLELRKEIENSTQLAREKDDDHEMELDDIGHKNSKK